MDIVTRIAFRGLLRGLAEEGRWCHRQVEKTREDQRTGWRRTKSDLGYRARIAGLAYGMVRGRAYAELEYRTKPLPEPVRKDLALGISALLKAFVTYGDRFAWREDRAIETWLKTEPTEALKEAHRVAEEHARQQRAEARRLAADRRAGRLEGVTVTVQDAGGGPPLGCAF